MWLRSLIVAVRKNVTSGPRALQVLQAIKIWPELHFKRTTLDPDKLYVFAYRRKWGTEKANALCGKYAVSQMSYTDLTCIIKLSRKWVSDKPDTLLSQCWLSHQKHSAICQSSADCVLFDIPTLLLSLLVFPRPCQSNTFAWTQQPTVCSSAFPKQQIVSSDHMTAA